MLQGRSVKTLQSMPKEHIAVSSEEFCLEAFSAWFVSFILVL